MNFRFTAFLFLAVVALVVTLLITNLTDPPPRPDAGLLEPLGGVKAADIDTVEITRTEPVAETLVFKKNAGKWELTAPFAAKVDAQAVDGLVRDLFEATPTTFKDLTTNLKVHGLDNPVKVTLKKGDTAATVAVGDTTIGGPQQAVTFLLPADRPTTPVAVRTSSLRSLFRDSAFGKDGTAAALTKRANDFRQIRLLSFSTALQGSDLTSVKVTKGTTGFELLRQGDGTWTFTAPAGYGEADVPGDTRANPDFLTGVQPLLAALDTFRPAAREDYIEQVPDAELPKYGLAADDPAVIRVDVTPKAGPPETLFIGKAVETPGGPAPMPKVYCRLAGDPAVVPVATDRVKLLANTAGNPSPMRNRDLIRDTSKPRIDALDVTVGATTVRLRKVGVEPNAKWVVYGGPSDPTEASKPVVTDLLDALCAPRAALDVLNAPNDAAFAPAEVKGSVKVYFDGIAKPEPLAGDKLPPEPAVAAKESAPPVTLTFGQLATNAVHTRRAIGTNPPTDFLLPLNVRDGEKVSLFGLATRARLDYLNPSVGSFSPAAVQQVKAVRGADTLYDLTFTDRDKLADPDKGWFPLGKWANAGKPASAAAVQQLLFALAALDQAKPLAEAPPDADLTAWGLKPPRLTVTVTLKSDPTKPRAFEFGGDIPAGPHAGKVYFRLGGRLMVLAADKLTATTAETTDLRDPVVHRVARSAVTRVDFSWPADTGGRDEVYAQPDAKEKWVVTQPAGFKTDADKVESLVKLVEVPLGGALVPGPEKPEYKLTGDVLRVLIHRGQPGPVEFVVGAEDETKQFVYAKSSDTPGAVVKLPAAAVRPFLAGKKALSK